MTTYALNQVGNGGLISRMPAYPEYTDAQLTAIAQYLLSLK